MLRALAKVIIVCHARPEGSTREVFDGSAGEERKAFDGHSMLSHAAILIEH